MSNKDKREVFVAGATWGRLSSAFSGAGLNNATADDAEALRRFPKMTVERERVVEDHGYDALYRVRDGLLEQTWSKHQPLPAQWTRIAPVDLVRDLLARPTETVEVDE